MREKLIIIIFFINIYDIFEKTKQNLEIIKVSFPKYHQEYQYMGINISN